ncbi:hypothetical protein ECZU08_48130 [Escherichia coli]|nr:hypothetical protein ECZU08_48130 [Escherichia coli]
MFIGFDYGTANCSVAVMRDGKPHLLKMENDSTLLPSMLCAPTREAVSEWLYRHHDVPADDDETQALLRRAIRYNREEDIDVTAKSVQFGLSSLAQYIDDPEEVWFVKSPKSFLGASGLKPQQVALFEDLVCAMMLHIRQQAQAQLPEAITQAVIGRPINFRGWAVMKQTPVRKGFWNARRSVPGLRMWYSSTSRSRLGWITKPPCRKKNECW